MKARCSTVLTALSLALLCFGTAGAARAASVSGEGVISFPHPIPPLVVSVNASDSSGVPQGTMTLRQGNNQTLLNVIDLCVYRNRAVVIGQVIRATHPGTGSPPWFYFFIEDNGAGADLFTYTTTPSVDVNGVPISPYPCLYLLYYFNNQFNPNFLPPLTVGNFRVFFP